MTPVQLANPRTLHTAVNVRARRTALEVDSRLQHASGTAVSTLLTIMADRTAPHVSRVRAADSVLDGGMKAIELEDLEFRIQRLEKEQQERQDETR